MNTWIDGKSLITDLMDDSSMNKAERMGKLAEKQLLIDSAKTHVEQSYNKYKVNVLGEFATFK